MTAQTPPRARLTALTLGVAAITAHDAEFVNDFNGVVSPDDADAINRKAADIRDKYRSAQIAVVTPASGDKRLSGLARVTAPLGRNRMIYGVIR